jgi:flagellar biosynthesis/type III secretory pathway protein FliH
MSDPIIKKTFDKLKEISAMDEAQQIARARELGMLRVSMELDEARDEGLQKGRDEGLQKGRDEGLQKGLELGQRRAQAAMIRKFMDGGMSLDQIATILKMGRDELESLLSVGRN